MFINYSDIPHYPNIFLDYLYEFENVQKYFKKNFRNEQDFLDTISNVNFDNEKRKKLVQIIRNQYSNFKPSIKTLRNIDILTDENTYAIVTGQQLGIFTGPLYTLYKAITAIKLAEEYSQKYPEYNFVPIFWLEGDDHDFEEIRKIKVLDNENSLTLIQYNDGLSEETNRGPMGFFEFDSMIEETLITLQKTLRETEFKQKLIELLKTVYYPGANLKVAFTNLLYNFFDKYGLIIFDPQDTEVKKMMKHIFKSDLDNYKFVSEELIKRSAELEEIYHAQVKIKPINLFYYEDEGRYLIEPTGVEYRLKGKRKKFDYATLVEQIENNPEKFSPNVILRPLCQDTVLPTVVYVAGPSEVSYFAQLIPYYYIMNMEPPILYPRSSATIIETKVQNILDKYNLSLINFFIDIDTVVNNVLEGFSEVRIAEVFDETEEKIKQQLDELAEKIAIIDNTLVDVMASAKAKLEQYLNVVKDKTIDAQKRKNEIILRQIYKTANILFPDENLQEREINVIYFMNKYGLDFPDFLYTQLAINKFEHQVIRI